MTIVVNDSFSRANANPIGGIYTPFFGVGAVQIVSNAAQGTLTNATSAVADTLNAYPNDQWCQVTASAVSGTGVFELYLRSSNVTNSGNTYASWHITQGSTSTNLNTPAVGVIATIVLNTLPAPGDVYYFQVQGQLYSFYQNGTSVGTFLDMNSYVSSGSAGFGFYETSSISAVSISNFQAGNFIGPIVLTQSGALSALFFGSPTITGVTAGNTLVALFAFQNANNGQASVVPTIVDSAGQTWLTWNVPTTQQACFGVEWVSYAMFFLPNANSGTHTLTVSAANNNWQGQISEFSGFSGTPAVDKVSTPNGADPGTITAGSTNTTPATTVANSLVVAVVAIRSNRANSLGSIGITDPPSGFTSLASYQATPDGPHALEFCYKVVAATGTQATSWTWGSLTGAWQAGIGNIAVLTSTLAPTPFTSTQFFVTDIIFQQ